MGGLVVDLVLQAVDGAPGWIKPVLASLLCRARCCCPGIDGGDPQGPHDVGAAFDAFSPDLRVSYAGSPIELPERRPGNEEIMASDAGQRRLAGFVRAAMRTAWRQRPGPDVLRSCSISIADLPGGRCAFIRLYGIVAFVCGGLLAVIGIVAAVVQYVIARRRPQLAAHLPVALCGSGLSIAVGAFFAAAAEFRWLDGEALDDWVLPVAGACLVVLVGMHVLWLKRGRQDSAAPAPGTDPPGT